MKLTYAVVIEQYPSNYGAYAPDVPGCISTAAAPDGMLAMIREALTFHIEATAELATLGWVHWRNTERIHGYFDGISPDQFDTAYAAANTDHTKTEDQNTQPAQDPG